MKSYTRKQGITKLFRFLLFVTFLIVLQYQSNAQNDSLRQHYLQKSKNQNSGAWVMFGAGVTCWIIYGVAYNPVETTIRSAAGEKVDMGYGFITAGLIFIGGSIPLFICAGINKRKAAKISVSTTSWQKL